MLSGTAPGGRRLLKPETLKSMATNRLTPEQMKGKRWFEPLCSQA